MLLFFWALVLRKEVEAAGLTSSAYSIDGQTLSHMLNQMSLEYNQRGKAES